MGVELKWWLLAFLTVASVQAGDLSSYRWKKRVVLLFSGPGIARQAAVLAKESAGLLERDVELIRVDNRALKLQQDFQVTPGRFALVLIGKDGSEKFRSTEPVTAVGLFAIIDAMPMRQAEKNGNR